MPVSTLLIESVNEHPKLTLENCHLMPLPVDAANKTIFCVVSVLFVNFVFCR